MFLIVFFISLISAYANPNCDIVSKGDYLSEGYEKVVYNGKLGDKDVVIKEAKIHTWSTIEHRYQSYLSLYTEYEILKSLENDYPGHSMKLYGYCDTTTPFYIMERGERVTADEIHKEPLYRMIQRNVNASIGMIITMDIKWNQLMKKGSEIYTIDIPPGDVYGRRKEGDQNDVETYYELYTWRLYCVAGEQKTFSLVSQLLDIPPGPITCEDLSFKHEGYIPNTKLSYELMPDECTRVIVGEQIGKGAEKVVYRGTLDGKDVAIKKIRKTDTAKAYHASINLYVEFVVMQQYYEAYSDIALKPYSFCIDGTIPYYIIDLGYPISYEGREKYELAVKDTLIRMIQIGLYPRDLEWKQLVVKNDIVQLIDTGGILINDKWIKT